MADSRKTRKVDESETRVVRPLIKAKNGIGGFMVFVPAYVPSREFWIVYSGSMILKTNLNEDQATKLAYALNSAEWLEKQAEIDKKNLRGREFDLLEIYKVYPRKIGKTIGLKRLKEKIKTLEKYLLCMEAVTRYAQYVKDNNIEESFVKHFSSWTTSWQDWIPDNTEVSSVPQMSFDDVSKQIQF